MIAESLRRQPETEAEWLGPLPVREWFAQQAQIADLESQMAATQEDLDGLREQRERWKDPAFIEQQARERLNYAKPGEVPLVVINSDDATAGADGSSGPTAARTWYAKLWLSVEAASGRTDSEADTIKIRDDAPR